MSIPSPYCSANDSSSLLWQMLTGYWVSQTLHVAAKLQVVDHLSQQPQTSDELASVLGTNPRASWYLLRALVSVGIVSENDNGQFRTTPLGMGLHSATPGSLYSIALICGDPWVWEAWGNLLYSVQTGETAFSTLTGLEWSAYCEEFPDVGARAAQAMTAVLQHLYLAALQEYDFSAFHTVVAIGGGQERILTAVLAASPHLHGVFFDKPDVIAHLSPGTASKNDRNRYVLVGGDVLQSVPIGGDVYLVTQLLQAWDDGQAVTLLHKYSDRHDAGRAGSHVGPSPASSWRQSAV
jgi:hypothetical protein